MQLLHTRIEAQPGRKPQAATRGFGDGDIGQGSTLLTVTNTQPYENAFRIRIQCEHPQWQDEWVRLRALPLVPDATGTVQQTQRDQYGAHDRWIRLFVPQKQSRDVQILFDLPQNAQSRAGLYPIRVLIEEEALGSGAGTRGGSRRVHTLSAQLLVLPFYRWSLETRPRQARLGWMKRSAQTEIVVRNQGNDWLYCQLNLPDAANATDPQALRVHNRFVTRVAVPPPPTDEPDEARGSERAFLLRVAGGMTALRGAPIPLPLGVTATRLHAPTYPRWRDEATGELHTGAVVTSETTEQSALPPGSGGLYYPPIPAQITQAADGAGGFVRGLAGTLAGILIAAHIGVFLFEQSLRSNIGASIINNRVKVGDWVTVKGSWLPGSKILVKGDKDGEYVPVKAQLGLPSGSGKLRPDAGYLSFKADESLDGQTVQVKVQRVGMLPWMSALLPSSLARPKVTVGETQVAANLNGGTGGNNGGGNSGSSGGSGGGNASGGTTNSGGSGGANTSGAGGTKPGGGGAGGVGGGNSSQTPKASPVVAPSVPPTVPSVAAPTPVPPTPTPDPIPTVRPRTNPPSAPPNTGTGAIPPTYARLLMRDYTGANDAGDMSLVGRAIQARALTQTDMTQASRLAQSVQHEAGKHNNGLAYVLAGTVLMEQSLGAAMISPDRAAAAGRQIQSTYNGNVSRAPGCVLTYTVAAACLQTLGQHGKAQAILEQGERKALGDTKAAPIALAWAWHEIEENERARALLNRALQKSPELITDPQVQTLQSALQ